jgi:sulfofructose kinase
MKNKIYTLGAAVLDHVISVEEIPKKTVKIKGRQYIKRLGGPGAVASVVVASLGFNSIFIGRFGRDTDSLFLKNTLLKFNVNLKHSLRYNSSDLHTSLVIQDQKGERLVVTQKPKFFDSMIPKFKKINFTGTFLADLTWLNGTYQLCRKIKQFKGNLIIDADLFEINDKSKYIIENANYVIFSKIGLIHFSRLRSIPKALEKLYKKYKKNFAVTSGSKGVYWIDKGKIHNIKPLKVKAIETNGAGDVFHGAFACAIEKKFSINNALQYASVVASLKCTKTGGIYNLPTLKEINSILITNYVS